MAGESPSSLHRISISPHFSRRGGGTSLAFPLKVWIEVKADPEVELRMSWRTAGSEASKFRTDRDAALKIGKDWTTAEVTVDPGARVVNFRIILPKDYKGTASVRGIELHPERGQATTSKF